jgi:hypothetical protein
MGPDSAPTDMSLNTFQPAIERAWECITDTCDGELSSTSPLPVSIRLNYVNRVYRSTGPRKEQRLLKSLFGTLEEQGSHRLARLAIPRVVLNQAHNMESQKENPRAKTFAQQASQLLKDAMYAEKDPERMECLKIQAHDQFERGCPVDAEQNMEAAIDMIKNKMGLHHSWVYEITSVLEQCFEVGAGSQKPTYCARIHKRELSRPKIIRRWIKFTLVIITLFARFLTVMPKTREYNASLIL